MNLDHSDKVKTLFAQLEAFMDRPNYPNEQAHDDRVHDPATLWQHWPGLARTR